MATRPNPSCAKLLSAAVAWHMSQNSKSAIGLAHSHHTPSRPSIPGRGNDRRAELPKDPHWSREHPSFLVGCKPCAKNTPLSDHGRARTIECRIRIHIKEVREEANKFHRHSGRRQRRCDLRDCLWGGSPGLSIQREERHGVALGLATWFAEKLP